MSKSRRWEKPAPGGAPAQGQNQASAETTGAPGQQGRSQSPLESVTSFVESLNEEERASHRAVYLHLMQALTGCSVNINHADKIKLTGVLHAITPFEGQPHCVILKGCRVQRDVSDAGANDGKTAILDFAKVVTLQNAGKLDLVSRNYSTEFQTDSSIKKHGDMSHLAGRNLKSVDNSWLESAGDMSLEGKSSSGKSWDQFEANRRLFNVKDTYDENLYTKKLDLKSMTAEQIAKADRLAREIEGTVSSNIHLQEERGQAQEGNWDEEDRFSGVLKASDVTTNARKPAPAAADLSNPWRRGSKPIGGSASPNAAPTTAAPVAVAPVATKQPLTPPPGVTLPGAAPAAGKKEKTTTAAPAAAAPAASAETTVPAKATKTDEPAVEKKEEAASAPQASGSDSATPVTAIVPPVEAKPAAESAPVKKLNAAAAEFKPSWLSSTPATPTPAPAPAPQQHVYVPQQQYTPNHNQQYPTTPDMYANKMPHNSPMMSPQNHIMPDQLGQPYGAMYDPNVGINMVPMPQAYIPNSPQPMMFDNNFGYNQTMPMGMPAGMDYIPQMQMPHMMQFPGQIQGMPPGGEFYMQQPAMQMNFPNQGMGVPMGMPMHVPPMGMGGYSPQQGYMNNNKNMGNNNYNDKNGMRGNKPGGRGGMSGGRGNYGGGRGGGNNMGGMMNSPQQHGASGPGSVGGSDVSPDTA